MLLKCSAETFTQWAAVMIQVLLTYKYTLFTFHVSSDQCIFSNLKIYSDLIFCGKVKKESILYTNAAPHLCLALSRLKYNDV